MRHSKLQRQVDGAVHETEEAAVRLLGALGRSEHAKCATAQTPTACQSLVPVTALTKTGFVCTGRCRRRCRRRQSETAWNHCDAMI